LGKASTGRRAGNGDAGAQGLARAQSLGPEAAWGEEEKQRNETRVQVGWPTSRGDRRRQGQF
jgi:hypothetical protein